MIKLTKRFRQLRVLVEALLTGFASLGYVLVLIGVFNFILGVGAVNYFSSNDGFHFGHVRAAMATLFRIETLQGWEHMVHVGFFGCDRCARGGRASDQAPALARVAFSPAAQPPPL